MGRDADSLPLPARKDRPVHPSGRLLLKSNEMKKKALQILAGCLLLLGTSCYYDTLVEEEFVPLPPDEDISFAESIQPIHDKYNCASCHNGSRDPDLRAENAYDALVPDYVVVGDAEASTYYERLPGRGNHPPAGITLTGSEIGLIAEWINRGAEE